MTSPPQGGEAWLSSLGVHRIAVPVPFPDAGGPVNVYVIEDEGGFTLFDTGIGTPEGESRVREGLAALGASPARLKRILVSHGHVDHYGLAERLASESGASVHLHREDWDKVRSPSPWPELRPIDHDYLARLGVPKDEVAYVEWLRDAAESMGRRVQPGRLVPLEAGERLRFARFEAEVLHLPGHTPGLVCLWVPERQLLFADDHVLARVSPNPLLDLGREGEAKKFRALVAYLESARRVLALDVDWVLPGHGPPFQEHRTVLEGLFGFYRRRQEKILEALRRSPASAYDLIQVVFGKREPIRLFLTLSEVVGNLEVLEEAGQVRRALEGGVYSFRPATGTV
jgi:glyoxylase-like metal-dependent hydrolase (beta-lactamase superfamily II)